MVEHGYRQRRLGETHGVKGEMTEEVIRIVPRERIFDGVHEQIVFLNGPWVTVAGGDDEYTKKLIASDGLYSPKGSGNRDDVVSGRETLALEKWQMWCSQTAASSSTRASNIDSLGRQHKREKN